MAWTAITAAQTDADSPLDQALMDLIRTNDQDHETRIVTTEAASTNERVIDHFNKSDGTPTGFDDSLWVEEQSGGAAVSTIGTTLHQLVMNTSASGHFTRITSKLKFRPSDRPLFKCNFEQSASANLQPLLIGLMTDRTITTDQPTDGIFLFKASGADSNTVIRARRASLDDDSSTFGIKGNGLMRTLVIDYVATNRCVVTVDGTERFDITDGDLPRAQEELYVMVHWHSLTASAQTVFIDRLECSHQAPIDLV